MHGLKSACHCMPLISVLPDTTPLQDVATEGTEQLLVPDSGHPIPCLLTTELASQRWEPIKARLCHLSAMCVVRMLFKHILDSPFRPCRCACR